MVLNDANIREALLAKLKRQKNKPKALLEELHVHNGKAIADVVALYAEAHCFEIKGETDRIERVVRQGAYYNTAFRRITLVTTECKLNKAFELAPSFWGIMTAVNTQGRIGFRHRRAANLNPQFEKHSAAMTLWKNEMLELVPETGTERMPRRRLAKLIAETKRELELSTNICDQLLNRQNAQIIAPNTM